MVIGGALAVIGIVVGTIAAVSVGTAAAGFFADNNRSVGRMARFQRRVEVGGKISPDSRAALRKFKVHVKKQRRVMKFGVRDLQMRVNSFKSKTKVNKDKDFEQLWVLDKVSGSIKKLYRCKAKEVIQDLKGRNLKYRRSAEMGISDVMKTNGFMKAPIVNAGDGGTYLVPIAETLSNTYNACRDQMASDIVMKKGMTTFNPCKMFGKIINRNIKKCGMKFFSMGQTYTRYSIDYPEIEGGRPSPDRFVLGCGNTNNLMYNASKILMIAKACSKFNQHIDLGKVRVIEGVGDKVQVEIKNRTQFRQYVSALMTQKEFNKGLKEIEQIDSSAARFIQKELNEFTVCLESEISTGTSPSTATASPSAATASASTATASPSASAASATAPAATASTTADIAIETMNDESYFAIPAIEPTVIYDAPSWKSVTSDLATQAKELLDCGFTHEQIAKIMAGDKGRD